MRCRLSLGTVGERLSLRTGVTPAGVELDALALGGDDALEVGLVADGDPGPAGLALLEVEPAGDEGGGLVGGGGEHGLGVAGEGGDDLAVGDREVEGLAPQRGPVLAADAGGDHARAEPQLGGAEQVLGQRALAQVVADDGELAAQASAQRIGLGGIGGLLGGLDLFQRVGGRLAATGGAQRDVDREQADGAGDAEADVELGLQVALDQAREAAVARGRQRERAAEDEQAAAAAVRGGRVDPLERGDRRALQVLRRRGGRARALAQADQRLLGGLAGGDQLDALLPAAGEVGQGVLVGGEGVAGVDDKGRRAGR
ncbi:hypothetical protein [Nannocystis pusilla]|uniref:hypothetical protein n=1 Tax=Nannocystis pusilla TaxID=889268 RepID=UPI003B7C0D86